MNTHWARYSNRRIHRTIVIQKKNDKNYGCILTFLAAHNSDASNICHMSSYVTSASDVTKSDK